MSFNSVDYFVLLGTTLLLFARLSAGRRLWLLILSSLLFYASWSVPLVGLIVLSAVVDYHAGLGIARSSRRNVRLAFLLASICVNLGMLGYFKYANFFLENVELLLGRSATAQILSVVLPPGISFYTFQTMSYTIDVYRGQLAPTRSFARFFLFVCFFPQLVAGPIERAGRLLPQLQRASRERLSFDNLIRGARLILLGMFKKVVIADHMAEIVNPVYSLPGAFDGWSGLIATYAFTLQIYCDFSAYSEIARGSARLFGVELMRNFDQPYLATNISDFWRRWHISLSTWIRDYLYLPLGGSRHGRVRTAANLVVTFFLSGLWHGAAWHFVLWGLYHGVLLVITYGVRRVMVPARGSSLMHLGLWFLNFHLVVVGWMLFRAESMVDFGTVLASVPRAVLSGAPVEGEQALFLVFVALFLVASRMERRFRLIRRVNADPRLSVVFYGIVIITMLLFGARNGPQFIYFQF